VDLLSREPDYNAVVRVEPEGAATMRAGS
jgi:hypothetical protein